ncbi:hypothetical protein M0812_00785 [Anaeramoeba flamelloides]|uniref:B-block binding subunit of TFIIIC domain-containing protein n=1 Tax=Anaeramoeba flamelloides TaxID=1746091 RepID=A0AAV8A1Z4_9EUKA|nr:hypothetical protein M0812_00785 [Anaeramoeba flamelloides]
MTNNQKKTNDTEQKKQPKKIGTVTQQQQVFFQKRKSTKTKSKYKPELRQQEHQYKQKRNINKVNDEDPNEILIAINNYEQYMQNQSTHLRKQQQVYNEAIQKIIAGLFNKLDCWMGTIGEEFGQFGQLNEKHFQNIESKIEKIHENNILLFKKLRTSKNTKDKFQLSPYWKKHFLKIWKKELGSVFQQNNQNDGHLSKLRKSKAIGMTSYLTFHQLRNGSNTRDLISKRTDFNKQRICVVLSIFKGLGFVKEMKENKGKLFFQYNTIQILPYLKHFNLKVLELRKKRRNLILKGNQLKERVLSRVGKTYSNSKNSGPKTTNEIEIFRNFFEKLFMNKEKYICKITVGNESTSKNNHQFDQNLNNDFNFTDQGHNQENNQVNKHKQKSQDGEEEKIIINRNSTNFSFLKDEKKRKEKSQKINRKHSPNYIKKEDMKIQIKTPNHSSTSHPHSHICALSHSHLHSYSNYDSMDKNSNINKIRIKKKDDHSKIGNQKKDIHSKGKNQLKKIKSFEKKKKNMKKKINGKHFMNQNNNKKTSKKINIINSSINNKIIIRKQNSLRCNENINKSNNKTKKIQKISKLINSKVITPTN